ncbi:MAG: S8 family serine peptidase [Bdellovibrionales bacterium]|nr:S8 family serine peptidase [Bdellovibrionales bacterium]
MSVSNDGARKFFGIGALAFLTLPLLLAFTNCEQSGGGKKSKKSLSFLSDEDFSSKYCGRTLASGKLKNDNPFATGKVQIGDRSLSVSSKGGGQNVSLVVLAYTECLEALTGNEKTLSSSLIEGKRIIPDIKLQALRYEMPRAMSLDGLKELADADSCIKGIAINDEYKLHSLSDDFNDREVAAQKHLETIRAEQAYDIIYHPTTGISKVAGSGALPDVKIAVIDSGVDVLHEDLQNKIWKFNLAGEPNKVYAGVDATTLRQTTPEYFPEDPIGHGTHVAGLIAASSNNGTGVTGVMPFRSRIMAIAASRQNSAGDWVIDTASVVDGIRWAALNGADVINLGHGTITDGNASNAAYREVLNEVIPVGITVVTVAGSTRSNSRLLDGVNKSIIPGIYGNGTEGILTVGSSQAEDKTLSDFSMYGPSTVEIAAPGSQGASSYYPDAGLISTVPTALASKPYASQEGTSMSGALVSGAAGIVIAWIRDKAGTTPHPCVVEGVIKEAAEKRSNLGPYIQEGRHLNLYNIAVYLRKRWP